MCNWVRIRLGMRFSLIYIRFINQTVSYQSWNVGSISILRLLPYGKFIFLLLMKSPGNL